MNFMDIIGLLEQYLPILATLTGHPELGILAQKLIDIGEKEVARRMNETGMTRSEILIDARNTYAEAQAANDDLKKLGHE